MSTIRKDIFNEEDISTLIAHWDSGATAKEIALIMERPYHNIRNKIRALHKKGIIDRRSIGKKLPDDFAEQTAAEYQLPIDVVSYFISLFSGTHEKIKHGVQSCCQSYIDQQHSCYYLPHIKLTLDKSPSGAVALYGQDNKIVLVCRAVAHTRSTMSHDGFVGLCKTIASQF